MGDTEIIKKPWMRELREWGTFCMSFLFFPVAYLIVHNVKLEIMTDVASKYVSQSLYDKDALRQDQERGQAQITIGNIQGKVESIQLEQIHQADSLSTIKEQLSNRKAP